MIKVSVIITLLFLAGCESTPKTTMPTYRLHNPEVNSTFSASIATGIGSVSTVAINGNQKTNSNEDNESDTDLFIKASIVAIEGLKVSFFGDIGGSDNGGIMALYQFYGLNADKSVEGNVSQAFSLGYINNDGIGFYDLPSSSPYTRSNWEQDTKIIDFAWVSGYRINPDLIVYGGPFFQWGKSNVMEVLSSSSETIEDLVSNQNNKGNLYGANIALEYRFKSGLGLTGEVVYSKAEWSKSTVDDASLNFKVDYQF